MFNLDDFIKTKVICRDESLFAKDLFNNALVLKDNIEGKKVLVIGGAGSIGSSFIKALLPFNPHSLVVVDLSENGLTELTRDLRSSGANVPADYTTYPMDFSSDVFRKMFISRGGFDIVANFSAHKHVRSEKDIFSIETLLRNNVLNARKLLNLLAEFPPQTYFCVSTDKAANPVNIMGASKRIMEDLIFSYSDIFPVKTARFANVAFSNGSLPAGFLERIQKLQPISAPTDVKRYFVSPTESGEICLLSCILGNNREIFFPKLNENQMMTFDSIATDILEELGYKVICCDTDEEAIELAKELQKGSNRYPVHFSLSDTSGEKGYEEFYIDEEKVDMDRFISLGVVVDKSLPNLEKMNKLLSGLEDLFVSDKAGKEAVVKLLENYLPNFFHIETGKSLDSKM